MGSKEQLIHYIEELLLSPAEPWMLAHIKRESEVIYSLAEYACGAIDMFRDNADSDLFVYSIKDITFVSPHTSVITVEFGYEPDHR